MIPWAATVRIRSRRGFLRDAAAASLLSATAGCLPSPGGLGEDARPAAIWGRRGWSPGRLLKPRALAIDAADQLYLVDTTGRIQVYSSQGEYLRGWKTPETEFGRPTGLSITPDQQLLVADTHYFRMLVFELDGTLLPERTIGGTSGRAPGEFAFVTDAVCDRRGIYYIGQYGDWDQIQRFEHDGSLIDAWGATGRQAGQFLRPQSLVLSEDHHQLWVADACNHRIQVFDISTRTTPRLVQSWGREGKGPGELYYPYDLAIAGDGSIFVCEYGNQRVQRFSPAGQSLGILGRPGHGEGEFYQPWGLTFDSQGRLFVLDSNNHRVQRFDRFA